VHTILIESISRQIGGSARGYQELPAPLAIPATAARLYFYALPALDVNFRFCRDRGSGLYN
jgi:hypothetical protein